ncbi:MAG: glycosyltransferase [Planctomycetota bacterium]
MRNFCKIMPSVSVIIPTYNRADVVVQALSSALNQTHGDLEVLIIDDGSTDNTRPVIEAVNDDRIRYYYKENGGVSSARNLGIAESDAQYIAFLDSDDIWPENFLGTLLNALRNNPGYGLAYASVEIISSRGLCATSHLTPYCKSGSITIDLFKKGFIWISTVVLARDALADLRFDESLKNGEDSDFLLRLSLQTKFLYVPGASIKRTSSPDSLSCSAGINCNRILSLERFYFRLGGNRTVPAGTARRKLSHACRRIAREHHRAGNLAAARYLYKKAFLYYPFDLRLCVGFAKTVFKTRDNQPAWQMPPQLADPVCSEI